MILSRLYGVLRDDARPFRKTLVVALLCALLVLAIEMCGIVLEAVGGVRLTEILVLAASRVLLLPLYFAAYLAALHAGFRREALARSLALQAAVALALELLWPDLITLLNYWALDPEGWDIYVNGTRPGLPHVHLTLLQALDVMRHHYIYVSVFIATLPLYLFGLAFGLGLRHFLDMRTVQMKFAELQVQWMEARLALLRQHLKPHFLFNGLNTIVALIRANPDLAERMLVDFSDLLRQIVDRHASEFITVREEMQFIERYLAALKLRYPGRLLAKVEVDEGLLDREMPAFLLVPLVENCIKHGMAERRDANSIFIRGSLDGEFISFMIRNPALPAACSGRAGTGLMNLRQRLAALYGTRHRFSSAPDGQGDWLTSLFIPAHPQRV